jgi:hypothetical protein
LKQLFVFRALFVFLNEKQKQNNVEKTEEKERSSCAGNSAFLAIPREGGREGGR